MNDPYSLQSAVTSIIERAVGGSWSTRRRRRLRCQTTPGLTGLVEDRQHVILFGLRTPQRHGRRHLLQLVDPTGPVLRRYPVPDRLVSDCHPDWIGERLRIIRVERESIGG